MAGSGNNIAKYRRPVNLNIGMIIFAVIFIYVVICVFMYFSTEHVVGYEVKEGALSSDNTYEGIALRTEKIITCTDAGYTNYYAREGERIAVGDLVYTIDETGRLADYVKTSETGENSLSDKDLSELKAEIESFSHGFDRTNFSDIYNFKYNVQGTVIKLANYNVLENANALNEASNTALINYYRAVDSGIVLYSVDGYEELTLQDMNNEYFDEKNYERTYLLNNELVATGDPVYKLSTNEDWSVVIPVDEQFEEYLQKEKYGTGKDVYVEVRFLKNQYTSWGLVDVFTNAEGDMFASLTFTNSMITFCTDRFLDIELLLEDEKGLKIPNSAIVEKEFYIVPKEYVTQGGNSGHMGVLLETYDEEGNTATEFVETTIYEETDTEYYLDDTVLRSGSYLIKPDSTEKYAVSRMGSLIGVYNINKGYADFKQIIILDQNEEYSIVKSNTTYGLNVYDYIVLDAETVEDNDFIYE
ncbi:MAG: hypothetical protein NC314_09420 [Roseburia sp.]|nr:hypothetical protein [Ruminococcus sp.]MCM1154562.1 hypothetical protein [Roseburia sp.]MCM1243047.1 hypothetical protein [Roseburia sp.]